jgi:hypothetical protein
VSCNIVNMPLAGWKKTRIAEVRMEEERRFDAFPNRVLIREILVGMGLINIKAVGGTLTVPQTNRLAGIINQANNTVLPISNAAQAGVDAINAANTHAEVEVAYASIVWP